MTQREYLIVCSMIDKQIKSEWVTPNYCKRLVDNHGVVLFKEELKKLVKGKCYEEN